MILKTVSRFKGTQRILVAIFFIAGFVYISGPFLATIAMGAVLAIVLAPFFRRLRNRNWSPRMASGLLTVGLTLTLLVPTALLTVFGGRAAFVQLQDLNIERYGSLEGLAESPRFRKVLLKLTDWTNLPPDAVFSGSKKALGQITATFSKLFGDLIYQIPEIVISLVAMVLAIYYFLADGHRIQYFLKENSPFNRESTQLIFTAVENACFSVIVATFLSALAQTLLMAFGAFITATPNVALVGVFTFLCAFLPVLGTAPMSLGLFIYHLSLNHPTSAILIALIGLIVSLIDNVIHIVVLRNRGNLHPLVGFIAVFGGLQVLGVTGLFLGPIVAALAIAVLPILLRETKAVADQPRTLVEFRNDTPPPKTGSTD
jgi:predicted PurR-regulated permease PerM